MSGTYLDGQSPDQIFQQYLVNESVLWAGQPETKVVFTWWDILFIPFSLLFGGFAIFWEIKVIITFTSVFLSLLGIPFVIIGLYMIFGRFIYKMWNKKRTYYAVTNRRIIIISRKLTINRGFILYFRDWSFRALSNISKNVGSGGTGTITFEETGYGLFASTQVWYLNSGMDIFVGSYNGYNNLNFFDIRDADKVYDIILDAKSRFDH